MAEGNFNVESFWLDINRSSILLPSATVLRQNLMTSNGSENPGTVEMQQVSLLVPVCCCYRGYVDPRHYFY